MRTNVTALALIFLGACTTSLPQNGSVDGADLSRALSAAQLHASRDNVEYTAMLTPAKPRDGSAALFARTPRSWNAGDGQTGSIGAPGNYTNPYDGGQAGIAFQARAGLRYLVSCRIEHAGTDWDFNFGGAATGNAKLQTATTELPMLSDRTAQTGPAELVFATKQGTDTGDIA